MRRTMWRKSIFRLDRFLRKRRKMLSIWFSRYWVCNWMWAIWWEWYIMYICILVASRLISLSLIRIIFINKSIFIYWCLFYQKHSVLVTMDAVNFKMHPVICSAKKTFVIMLIGFSKNMVWKNVSLNIWIMCSGIKEKRK